jgi:hypothetical protein
MELVHLYNHYMHFNHIEGTWNIFDRNEQSIYLTDRQNMKSLITFNTTEDFIKYINECIKKNND